MSNEAHLKVLIVDDELINRALLLRLLPALGFAAEAVENGHAALGKVAEWQPDVVLMDMMMPGMDGIQTTKALRDAYGAEKPYIVIVSASSQPEDKKLCAEAGCNGFLSKPIRQEVLLGMLNSLLA